MKSIVYIIYSKKIDKYYVGFSRYELNLRLSQHNKSEYGKSYTKSGIPWVEFMTIECVTEKQAMQIEKHIKRMKSKKYIENLKKCPEMIEKLRELYL